MVFSAGPRSNHTVTVSRERSDINVKYYKLQNIWFLCDPWKYHVLIYYYVKKKRDGGEQLPTHNISTLVGLALVVFLLLWLNPRNNPYPSSEKLILTTNGDYYKDSQLVKMQRKGTVGCAAKSKMQTLPLRSRVNHGKGGRKIRRAREPEHFEKNTLPEVQSS